MTLRTLGSLLASGALAAFFASPASALDDATGTYEGKMKCDYVDGGNPVKEKHDITIRLIEEKDSDRLGIDTAGGTFIQTSIGQVLDNVDKPDRGKFSSVTCLLDAIGLNGSSIHADLVIKPESEKGSIKGTVHVHQQGTAGFCTFSAKRTSVVAPDVFLCQ